MILSSGRTVTRVTRKPRASGDDPARLLGELGGAL